MRCKFSGIRSAYSEESDARDDAGAHMEPAELGIVELGKCLLSFVAHGSLFVRVHGHCRASIAVTDVNHGRLLDIQFQVVLNHAD